MSIYHI